jgi:hypothetical protein
MELEARLFVAQVAAGGLETCNTRAGVVRGVAQVVHQQDRVGRRLVELRPVTFAALGACTGLAGRRDVLDCTEFAFVDETQFRPDIARSADFACRDALWRLARRAEFLDVSAQARNCLLGRLRNGRGLRALRLRRLAGQRRKPAGLCGRGSGGERQQGHQ